MSEKQGPRYYGEPDYILNMSSVNYEDFDMENQHELAGLVADILKRITSHINSRLLQEAVEPGDDKYPAVCDIAERKAMRLLGITQQMLVNDLISTDDLEAQLVEITGIMDDLSEELESLQEKNTRISATGRDDIGRG